MKPFIKAIVILIFLCTLVLGQGKPYSGPEDPAGDISATRTGYMDGNRVILYFENNTYLGEWDKKYNNKAAFRSKWPNNYEGLPMFDQIFVQLGAEVYLYQDSIPITDPNEIDRLSILNQIDTLYFLQTHSAYSKADLNYEKTIQWQYYAAPGYFNETQDYPAMSNKADSWPLQGWPSTGFEKKWPGEWNGRFGRGIKYADLETYYVVNDAQDLEYIVERNDPDENLISEGPRYYPRPGKTIGYLNPSVTVQKDKPWGGLGLRTSVRGFQWNNPEARDMIFWEYDISNISDYDLPVCGLGYYLGAAVGGEDWDNGFFDKELDLAYVWDWDGIGLGGIEPGIMGMAYLESPGKPYDNKDNDNDGLVNEKRDNDAGELIGPFDGISNLPAFLDFYKLTEEDLRVHYEGDEDQDWDDGIDLNGNGTYAYQDKLGTWNLEPGEHAGDDVGLDGVGPSDLNYNGPDEGECNHRPDFIEGVGCEPDFAATDVSESDMLGLTSFHFFQWGEWQKNGWVPHDDKHMWQLMDKKGFEQYFGDPVILYFVFASTRFPLFKGRTERISMGILHAYENLANLNSSSHSARTLFRLKQTAQVIYEKDYRFAQPPLMPTLSATAGDGKVFLSWNDVSDKLTREPFLDNINDFEGYKLYRATDKLMSDPEIITDGQGTKMFKKPIFQCDLIDYKEGYADFGSVGGTSFYLGDETGLTHHFIDENVQNGRTYYYALVAYDYGAKEVASGISPTENNVVIELDEAEEIIRMGKNVQVVIPRQDAAGYIKPDVDHSDDQYTDGSGTVVAEVFDKNAVKENHQYRVTFTVDTLGHYAHRRGYEHAFDVIRINNGLKVYDETEDRLVYEESVESYPMDNVLAEGKVKVAFTKSAEFSYYNPEKELITDIFDGLRLRFTVPTIHGEYDEENSGWLVGKSPITIKPSTFETAYSFPYQYELIWTDSDTATIGVDQSRMGGFILKADGSNTRGPSDPLNWEPLMFEEHYNFYVVNKTFPDDDGNYERLDLVAHDLNKNGHYDKFEDEILAGHVKRVSTTLGDYKFWGGTLFAISFEQVEGEEALPKPGDIYRLDFKRPYFDTDSIRFTVSPEVEVSDTELNEDMKDIKVVPNPYVMTNAMEPAVDNKFLNQRRRLMFTHIPADCVIRIFTSSGVLVDRIDVDHEPSNGVVHWDLLSKEDLEVAAGMFVYHVKSNKNGKEKIGKFAVIK